MRSLVEVPTGNTIWAGLASLAKPSGCPPPPPSSFFHIFVCFSFYTGAPSPFLCPRVDFYFWGAGLSSRPIPKVVGSCWKGAWAWAWVCQTLNSVLLCWLLFFWPYPPHSACSFLWAFNKVPRGRSSSAMALLGLGCGP